jgi:hypothetical protein
MSAAGAQDIDPVLRELHGSGFTALACEIQGLQPQQVCVCDHWGFVERSGTLPALGGLPWAAGMFAGGAPPRAPPGCRRGVGATPAAPPCLATLRWCGACRTLGGLGASACPCTPCSHHAILNPLLPFPPPPASTAE